MPLDGIGEDEGEVALDGLVAGEVVGCDLLQGKIVEGGEVQLGEVDGLAELAVLGLRLVQLAEVGYGLVVEKDCGRAAGLEPCGGLRGEGDGGGASGWAEEGEQGLDGSLELEEWGVLGDVEGRGRLWGRGGQADGKGWGLVDLGDVGGVGGRGAGEGLALLEVADRLAAFAETTSKL